MSSNLFGSAKYANRRRNLVPPQPCSVANCGDPAHAGYRAATGHQFCMRHQRRYQLMLLAQRLHPESMTTRKEVEQSEMRIWVDLAIDGNDESVEQHLKVHSANLAKYKIDESVL